MAEIDFKPGNMLYPLPAVLVTVADKQGKANIFTVAWAGTVCTNPPMLSISVRPERYSYHLIEESGEFVVNLTTKALVKATDFCGVRSGRDLDKFKECHLTPLPSKQIHAPGIADSEKYCFVRSFHCNGRGNIPEWNGEIFGIYIEFCYE